MKISSDPEYALIEAHGSVDTPDGRRLATIIRAMCMDSEQVVVLDLTDVAALEKDAADALVHSYRHLPEPRAGLEVQTWAGAQPEAALRKAQAHDVFSLAVWDRLETGQGPERLNELQGNLELWVPARADRAGRVRSLMEQVLLLTGVDENWLSDFVLAVGEALANALTHGSPPGGKGYVIFRLWPGQDGATAEVRDFGPGIHCWNGHASMPSPWTVRGRGLGMMQVFADDVDIETGPTGTCVRLVKRY